MTEQDLTAMKRMTPTQLAEAIRERDALRLEVEPKLARLKELNAAITDAELDDVMRAALRPDSVKLS